MNNATLNGLKLKYLGKFSDQRCDATKLKHFEIILIALHVGYLAGNRGVIGKAELIIRTNKSRKSVVAGRGVMFAGYRNS